MTLVTACFLVRLYIVKKEKENIGRHLYPRLEKVMLKKKKRTVLAFVSQGTQDQH